MVKLSAPCVPVLDRCPAFQKAGYRNILVDGWPVDALAFAEQLEGGKLFGRGTGKARKPGQWNRQDAPVVE